MTGSRAVLLLMIRFSGDFLRDRSGRSVAPKVLILPPGLFLMHISAPVFLVHARNTMNVMTVAVAHERNVTMISAKHCLTHAMLNTVLVSADNSVTEWQDYIAI